MRTLLHCGGSILIAKTRTALHDCFFMQRHRAHEKFFTRNRLLTFPRVCLLLLQKTVRSAQCHLNDFFKELDSGQTSASASAWTQARAKLKHTAFIELNEQVLLPAVYDPLNDFKPDYWRGLRLLAIDSSVIRLPSEEAVGKEFGWQESSNGTDFQGRYVQGRLSVLYDAAKLPEPTLPHHCIPASVLVAYAAHEVFSHRRSWVYRIESLREAAAGRK